MIVSMSMKSFFKNLKVPYYFIRDKQEQYKIIVNKRPIIILGNQKSGTTAIANLLGIATRKEITGDIHVLHRNTPKNPTLKQDVFEEKKSLKELASNHPRYFNRKIIKEPILTFHFELVRKLYPNAFFVFVIRDPRNNIRSILDRLKIPGNLDRIGCNYIDRIKEKNMTEWQFALEGKYPDISGPDYISILAKRWNYATNIYINNKSNFILIKYEDFLKDKIGSIWEIAAKTDLGIKEDISDKVDKQYQPLGNRSVNWIDFFGENNLRNIELICSENMTNFNYKLCNRKSIN